MAVIRVPIVKETGGSALADILQGLGATTTNYAGDVLAQRERERRDRLYEQGLAEKRFDIDRANQAALLELAQTLPEEEMIRLFGEVPATMQAPDPDRPGENVEVPAPGSNLVLDAETGEFKPEARSVTEGVAIPEHLGGGRTQGLPVVSATDIEEQAREKARRDVLAARELEEEMGDRVTVTQSMIDSLPEALQPLYGGMVGQTVDRRELGPILGQVAATERAEKMRLEAEGRQEERRIAAEQRANTEWDRRLEERMKSKGLAAQLTDDQLRRFAQSTAPGWREFDATHLTRDNFGKRTGIPQSEAVMLAKELGVVIPSKKLAEQTLAAKEALADINQIKELLKDERVRDWVGAYAGRITDWEAKGWTDPLKNVFGKIPDIPEGVWQFRAALNRLAAEERHKIFGAAVTQTEVPFAESFIPSMKTSINALEAAVNEAEDSIVRGLDALWGAPSDEAPGGATPGAGDVDPNDPGGLFTR